MKIAVLAENTTCSENFACEHGLSLYIETEKHRILFDFGQSDIFIENARRLGIDLGSVDIAILSHGHYDHGGGLGKFLEMNKSAKVYVSKYAFGQFYNGTEKYIGLDEELKNNSRIELVADKLTIDDELEIRSCNDKSLKYPLDSAGLTKKVEGDFIPDDFCHEQYLIVSGKKRVVFSGCAHKGVANIISWLSPDVFVGGLHLMKYPLDRLEKKAEELDGDVGYYTCHCTGVEQYNWLKNKLRVNYISTGQIEII